MTRARKGFLVLAELDYKDKWYIYLEPVEPSEDFEEGEIIIFELEKMKRAKRYLFPLKTKSC